MTTNGSTALAKHDRAMVTLDTKTQGEVVESIVVRGDLSGLSPAARAAYYVQLCESLGLNPATKPIAFMRLNGKEVAYFLRDATDQLAAIHRVNRDVIEGPEVRDFGGTKLLYCKAKAVLPNGRTETSVATLPLADLAMAVMKIETKAKRRVTLSILGLGLYDETDMEAIPANEKEPVRSFETAPAPATIVEPLPADEEPEALARFREDVLSLLDGDSDRLTYEQAAAVWCDNRAALAAVDPQVATTAWSELCKVVVEPTAEEQKKRVTRNSKLKRACAIEQQKRDAGPPDGNGPRGGKHPEAPAESTEAHGDAYEGEEAAAPAPSAEAQWREHLAQHTHPDAVANSCAKHLGEPGLSDDTRRRIAVERMRAIDPALGEMTANNAITVATKRREKKAA